MFYKVWSGLTKYLRTVVINSKRSFEIKDFALFMPVTKSNYHRRSSIDTSSTLHMGDFGAMTLNGLNSKGLRQKSNNKA